MPDSDLLRNALPHDKWRLFAACRGQTTGPNSIWLPELPKTISVEAKTTCESCPVRVACLEWALASERSWPADHRVGIYGGKSPWERAKIWRQRHKRQVVVPEHEPEFVNCLGPGCDQWFDAWRTIDGRPRRSKREVCSRECQLKYVHAKQKTLPRIAVCKLPNCEQTFNPFTTFSGQRTTGRGRQYCCQEHLREGVKLIFQAKREPQDAHN